MLIPENGSERHQGEDSSGFGSLISIPASLVGTAQLPSTEGLYDYGEILTVRRADCSMQRHSWDTVEY